MLICGPLPFANDLAASDLIDACAGNAAKANEIIANVNVNNLLI